MININKDINYITESLNLLCRIGLGKSFEAYCQEQVRSITLTPNDLLAQKKDLINLLTKIEKAFKKEFKSDMNDIMYYFAPFSEDGRDCIGRILLLWYGYELEDSLSNYESFRDHIFSLSNEEYNKKFGFLIQYFDSAFMNSSESLNLENEVDILKYIVNLSYSKDKIIKLEDAFINRKKHLEKIFDYVRRTFDLIKSFETDINIIFDIFCKEWDELTDDTDLMEFMMGKYPMLADLPKNEYGYIVYPYIMAPFRKGFGISTDSETGKCTGPLIISLGLFYGKHILPCFSDNIPDNSMDKDLYLNLLKTMSDPNRFKILTMIKDTPAYSTELAGQLGLTNATMSHHAGQLLSSYLATLKLEGTKSYYSSNKETIRSCIEFIRNNLL